jgi:acetyl-CoA acyltransferase 1
MERISEISHHLAPTVANVGSKKSLDDVVIVAALRTPMTRARKGAFHATQQEELLGSVLKSLLRSSGLKDPSLIDDIIVGNVLPPFGGANQARMAALWAGIPSSTSIATVNRQCSSGLQACAQIAHAIQSGSIEIGIGAGVESMTTNYGPKAMVDVYSEVILSNQEAEDCLIPMGITSENVAAKYGVSREKQDSFAALSHQKAARAQKNGHFKNEIAPVTIKVDGKDVTVTEDDGVRGDTTYEVLSKLKPAFKKDGTTTAGNSSQVTDGAAAVLLMKRRKAQELNLPIMGKWISFATKGVPPNIMGIGPAMAIPLALSKAGLKVEDIDVYELNEAFASQAVYCVEKLGIPMDRVNPNGGAISLGHPLGCTGARMVSTLLNELKRQKKRYGVISMCVGSGMGAAAVLERE